MNHFKEKLKTLRQKRGWSQEDLAREINVSLSTIQRWEKKDCKPTRLARQELARLFEEASIKDAKEYPWASSHGKDVHALTFTGYQR